MVLFSNAVHQKECRALAGMLLAIQPDEIPSMPKHRYGSGKQSFPKITEATTLGDLVNKDSWFTVNLLHLDMTFLTEDVDTWQNIDHFKAAKSIVDGLNVVNDPAERAVKLTTDLCQLQEKTTCKIFFVVECEHKARPNLRKRAKLE